MNDEIPLARPVLGREEEDAVARSCARGHLSLGPRVPAFEQAFAARVGAPHASAVSSGHRRTAPRAARGRRGGGRRGRHLAVLVRRERERVPLRAGAARVRGHRPGDAQPRPAGGRRGGHASARRRCCRSTSSATRPTCPPWSALGLPIVEDACEALGAVHADGTPVGGRGHAGRLRLLRQQAAHDGRGRDGHHRRRRRARSASTASATRGARRTWAGSTTTASASTTA